MAEISGGTLNVGALQPDLVLRQQANPAEIASKYQTLQTQMLNNRLLGQNVRATEAERAAAAASIGPNGQFDPDLYVTNLGKNKARPEAIAFGQEQRLSHLRGVREQLGITEQQGKLISDSMLPFIEKFSNPGPDGKPAMPTEADFANTIRTAIAAAGPGAASERLVALYADARGDPMKMMEAARTAAIIGNPSAETMNLLRGPMATQDTGPETVVYQTPGIGGETRIRARIEKGLSPGEADTPAYTYQDDQGVTRIVTKREAAEAAAKGVAPETIKSGSPYGVKEAATASGTASAGVWQKDLAEAGGYAQRIQGLDKATAALEKSLTGPGASRVQNFAAVLNTFGITAGPDVDSYAEAQKYLQDYANRRGADLGMGTDASRALVNAANPGVQTPKGAALSVVSVIKGLERMQAAQVAAAQAEKIPPEKYNEWRATWNRSVDPAAFAPPRLTKDEWEAKRKSMGDKWGAYAKGLQAALNAGVLKPSDIRK